MSVPDDFGSMLLAMFLAKAWPDDDGPEELASWEDVEAVMFDIAKMAHRTAETHRVIWEPGAVEALDLWLMDVSESGQFDGRFSVPREAARELERRSKFAVVAARLEHEAGEPLNLPFPRQAPDGLKGWGLALYILGGAARDYPEQFAK